MYIDPFLAGVITTVEAEFVAAVIWLFYTAWKTWRHKK
jgi:hypothetical protein